jgi:membrane protease YdiL (CAAX protease family)
MINSAASATTTKSSRITKRTRKRALAELAIAYVLILSVIWSPRPAQRVLWMIAVAAVAIIMARSWDGRTAIGLRRENFWCSMWVPVVALAIAGSVAVVSIHFHGLRLPVPPPSGIGSTNNAFGHAMLFVRTYWAYALWTFVQQFLLQGFFLLRLLDIMPGPKTAAFAAATLFALAHIPNPVLCITTLAWGFAACLAFLRYRNLYPLAIAHAIFGIMLAVTIPAPIIRNMRVGLGYLTYGHRHSALSPQPQGPDRVH